MQFKVLDRLFIKAFIGPSLLAFFIVEFVLVMQYLWKVIDDILGKGYGIMDYLELLFYLSVVLIPMALPLTVLLSSVMVYGEMSEKYELSSLKSAGISLFRMLKPGLVVAIAVMSFSILSSNIFKPSANEGFLKKIKQMKTNQLTFVFDEKIFNQEFKNYSIYIEEKEKDGRTIHGVLIYDHTDVDKSVLNMTYANTGEMYTVDNQKYLVMDLKDGYQVKEVRAESARSRIKNFAQMARPVSRFNFESMRKTFELNKLLNLNLTNLAGREYEMMNTFEMIDVIDSLNTEIKANYEANIYRFNNVGQADAPQKGEVNFTNSTPNSVQSRKLNPSVSYTIESGLEVNTDLIKSNDSIRTILALIGPSKKNEILDQAIKNANTLKDQTFNRITENRIKLNEIKKYSLRLHQQYSWAFVCLIFLFIGAPAGAIVRKGGFGFPLLIAIGFYMSFVITVILGEKLLRSGTLGPEMAAWLPCFILIPVAIYLTYKALNDRKLFEMDVVSHVKNLTNWARGLIQGSR